MRIVYATDGSDAALAAARALTQLPLEVESTITVLAVEEAGRKEEARAALRSGRQALAHCTASLGVQLRHGQPAQGILSAADDLEADLIVLGATGRTGLARLLAGSTAERVVRDASCSVLLVRSGHEEFGRILVGVDPFPPQDADEDCARWMAELPVPSAADLRKETNKPDNQPNETKQLVFETSEGKTGVTYLDWLRQRVEARLGRIATQCAQSGYRGTFEIFSGDPAAGLVQLASDGRFDLLVAVAHRHDALERWFLGSVTDRLVRRATCSVLVVRVATGRARTD